MACEAGIVEGGGQEGGEFGLVGRVAADALAVGDGLVEGERCV